MQIYLPNLLTRQGAIGLLDYLVASKDNRTQPNVIFNSDLNLEYLTHLAGGNRSIEGQHIENDTELLDFMGFVVSNFHRSSAQLFQDLYVLWKLESRRGGIFVEVGIGYPTGLNNTYLLESSLGWTGLGFEPNPAFHNSIRQTRSLVFVPKAVHTVAGSEISLCIPNNFHPGAFVKDNWEAKIGDENKDHVDLIVETVSLVDCLVQNNIPKTFDYCSYDTTGNVVDIEIIQSMLDQGWRPRVISVGHNYKSHRSDLQNMLQSRGYMREFEYISKWDDWYYDTSMAGDQ